MKIKDIYTNSKEELINFLLRYLCLNDISYVRVDDEVRFLDKIYRFYDNKDIDFSSTLEKLYNALNELEGPKKLSIDDDIFIGETIAKGRVYNINQVPNYNSNKKRLIKMQNRRNNLKLKNSR